MLCFCFIFANLLAISCHYALNKRRKTGYTTGIYMIFPIILQRIHISDFGTLIRNIFIQL